MTEPTGKKSVSMEEFLPPFIESTCEAFETMVFMPVRMLDSHEKHPGTPVGCISGTISLVGDDFAGGLSMMFDTKVANAIFCSMMNLDKSTPVDNQELRDVVGELANMVAGGAKSRLQSKSINFKIGLPSVVFGKDHSVEPPRTAKTSIVSMHSNEGVFYLELYV